MYTVVVYKTRDRDANTEKVQNTLACSIAMVENLENGWALFQCTLDETASG